MLYTKPPSMKPSILALIGVLLVLGSAAVVSAATNTPPAIANSDAAEAAYTRTIEKRAGDIIAVLDLKDPARISKVQNLIVAQYRSLRDWHDANDAKRKQAEGDELGRINASLSALHEKFISGLNAELTPDQVEKVKDKMTYGTVPVTFRAYCAQYPNLTDEEKGVVLNYLKEAREAAMDGGSSEEKHAIFRKYKGRINNYLNARGHQIGNRSSSNSTSSKPGQ